MFVYDINLYITTKQHRGNWTHTFTHKTTTTKLYSFANGNPLLRRAILADDGAAPLKSAVTTLRLLLADDIVASPAAQRRAVIHVVSCPAASTAGDPWVIHIGALLAKVGRSLVKEQVRLSESTGKLAAAQHLHLGPASAITQLRLVH